jgi:hypothetical protein
MAMGNQMPIPAPEQASAAGMSTTAPQQMLFVTGWAAMPDTAGTGISSVDVYLGGTPSQGGTLLGTATYGLPRPDVAEAFGNPEWTNSGFTFTWTPQNMSSSTQTLAIVAHSSMGDTVEQIVEARR